MSEENKIESYVDALSVTASTRLRTIERRVVSESIKVGDSVHVGHVQKGGAGVRGVVTRITGDRIHLRSHEVGMFGHKQYAGMLKNATKEGPVAEKTLNPAEMKKREEVAQAINRETPGMDKSKKMAIATATAKRVAEGVDQIKEEDMNPMESYVKTIAEMEKKPHTIPKTEREKELAAASEPHDKITHKDILVKRGVVKEEVELDEASFAATMKKAVAAHERGDHERAKYHLDNAKTARYAMKSTEISKHKDLLDKYKELRDMHEGVELDEEQLDELRSSTLKSYADKRMASFDRTKGIVRGSKQHKQWQMAQKAYDQAAAKRMVPSQAREEVDLDEEQLDELDKHSFLGRILRKRELKKKVDQTWRDAADAEKRGDEKAANRSFEKHVRYANLEHPGTWTDVKEESEMSLEEYVLGESSLR
jgi:hypothetical protein